MKTEQLYGPVELPGTRSSKVPVTYRARKPVMFSCTRRVKNFSKIIQQKFQLKKQNGLVRVPEPAISSVKVLILRYGIGPVEFPDFRGTGPQEL